MKIVIIIPTYNESDNIRLLIPSLAQQCSLIRHEIHLLVVDDNSPDGTANQVKKLMADHSCLHLLTGEKKGLGTAYIRGMRYALQELQADAVIEMDADFSHLPADVPRLLTALESGADFVIGSRYVKGGRVPEDWSSLRQAISLGGNIVARYLVGLNPVKDCTAGFRAIRSTVLLKIDFSKLASVKGYAFQVALLSQAMLNQAVVEEIPVEFVDRVRGVTKLGLSDIIEFLFKVWWLRVRSF